MEGEKGEVDRNSEGSMNLYGEMAAGGSEGSATEGRERNNKGCL